jgi:2-polyprenyl-3-methyl-5-hydroxy-6-metoxy-1,4-benzoquinol methylase
MVRARHVSDRETNRARLYGAYVSTHQSTAAVGEADRGLAAYVLPRLPRQPGARVLDVGCGAGDLVAFLQRNGYANAEGVDVSAEQVALAAERGVRNVRQGDLFEHLGANSAGYDAIIALDVLEHFETDEILDVLDAIAAALAPGGVLVARVPNAESPFFGRYRYGDLTHGLAFTTRSLRQAFSVAGFSGAEFFPVEPIRGNGGPSVARWALWKLVSGLLKSMLIIETGERRGHLVTQNLVAVARR